MIRPVRLALGAAVAFFGVAACSDASRVTSPDVPKSRAAVAASAPAGQITSQLSGNVCADVYEANSAPGTAMIAWQCHSAANQQFTWTAASEVRVFGDKCMDVTGGSSADGTPVIIWNCHGGANQKWKLTAANEVRGLGDKCLTVEKAGTSASPLTLRSCTGSDAQKWTVGSTAAQATVPDAGSGAAAQSTAPTTTAQATSAGPMGRAELPRNYIATAVSATPSGGQTIRVAPGGNLQAALDQAQPGDQVVLAQGATFVGSFRLRAKPGSGWITIRSEGQLPAEGTRMTPAAAASYGLPKILTRSSESALNTEPGAHNYRVIGVEIGGASGLSSAYDLVAFGSGAESSVGALPHHLILDRVYVHGNGSLDLQRCVTFNSAWSAVVDSYLGECHGRGHDSQAIASWNGSGPFKIVNNTLEGAGENVMFGGSDSRAAELVPSDIEFRRNHVIKPGAWQGVWLAKNLFELKVGKRVLIEGNIFEGSWKDGQSGTAIVVKSTNQDGSAPWSTTQDVTIRYNRIRRAVSAFGIDGNPEAKAVTQPTTRVTVAQNVFEPLTLSFIGGESRFFLIGNGVSDLTIEHNTGFSGASGVYFSSGVQRNFVLRNNVSHADQWGGAIASADGHGVGAQALAYHAPGAVVGGNLFVAANANSYPTGNMSSTNMGTVGFVNYTGMNFRLASGSAYKSKGTDGTDPGADLDAVDRYTSGVVAR